MNPEEMLTQLAPLRAPPEIGWWPLAPGWWALLIATLIASAFALRWYLRRRRDRRYRKLALTELQLLRENKGAVAEGNHPSLLPFAHLSQQGGKICQAPEEALSRVAVTGGYYGWPG
jgi:hypothetical protein